MSQSHAVSGGAVVDDASRRFADLRWLFGYVALYFGCQLFLLVPSLAPLRVAVRSGAHLGSIALIIALAKHAGRPSTLRTCAHWVVGILLVQMANLSETTALAALAQFLIYLAIIGPVFWVGRLDVKLATFRQLAVMLWLFYTTSAVMGVLQAYFPGSFQPPLSMIMQGMDKDKLMTLQIELASGEKIFRPMGLSDVPGGAAHGGMYAVLFGVGVLQSGRLFYGSRLLAVGSMLVGAMCLYLCQVRALVIMTGLCMFVMIAFLALTGRIAKFMGAALCFLAVAGAALTLASSVGGRQVGDRLATLTADSPGHFYYKNRGHFLERTFDVLPEIPLGAGLGRWGMVPKYFGNRSNYVWVEIQWTGWLYDGGVPLILAYVAAIVSATWAAVRFGFRRNAHTQEFAGWAALLVAYNVGAVALCFSYPPFIGNAGLEFWMLNATFVAAISAQSVPKAQRG